MRRDLLVILMIVAAIIFVNAMSVIQIYSQGATQPLSTRVDVSTQSVTNFTFATNTLSARYYNGSGVTIYFSSMTNVTNLTGWPVLNGEREELSGYNDRPQGTLYFRGEPGTTEAGLVTILERRK